MRAVVLALSLSLVCLAGCDPVPSPQAPSGKRAAPEATAPAEAPERKSSSLGLDLIAQPIAYQPAEHFVPFADPDAEPQTTIRIGKDGIHLPGVLRIDDHGIEIIGVLEITDDGIHIPGVLKIDDDGVVIYQRPRETPEPKSLRSF